jgi:outer membrane immunogenic protein
MRILAATSLALATLATPAFAQDADAPISGVHVTAVGGIDHVTDSGDSASGVLGGVIIGYDKQLSNIVIGGELEASISNTKYCSGAACVEAGRDLYAGARIGVPVGGRSMIYAKGGYTNARIVGTVSGNTVTSDNVDGWRAGVGAETNVGKLVARVEYRYSDYDGGTKRHQGLVGVGYRF